MDWLHNRVVNGAVIGFLTAALVDLHAWKSWSDVRFNVGTASFRWVSGAAFGAATAAGLGAL